MRGGWARGRRVLREWLVLAGLFVLLHAGLFAAWVVLDPRPGRFLTPVSALMGVYVGALVVVMAIGVRRIGRADEPHEYREARARGIPTPADVVAVEKTGWHTGRSRNFRLQLRPRCYEYRIRVRIARPDGTSYETCVDEYLPGNEVPERGAVVALRVHPERPEVAVLARPQA